MSEEVDARDMGQHVGRLVAAYRGRWVEILGVEPVDEDAGTITVLTAAPRFDVLQRPTEPGSTSKVELLLDMEYPVRDAPTDPAERAALLERGHQLVRPPEPPDPKLTELLGWLREKRKGML